MYLKRLKLLRKSMGLTQEQLAKVLMVQTYTIGDWERERTEPDLEKVILLANFFDVSTDYLLGRSEATRQIPSDSIQTGPIALDGNINDLTDDQKKALQALADYYARENKKK